MNRVHRALNRLAKWRMVFAGWQLGTRAKADPECQAVSDHREATLLLRAEVSALTRLLLETGTVTQEQLHAAVTEEAEELCRMLERRFPGIRATDAGIDMDLPKAAETMKGWKS